MIGDTLARKENAMLNASLVPGLLVILLGLAACSSPRPNRDPTGERFPDVVGESLDGQDVNLPADLAGEKALLLVGYVQKTQFDIDRWLLGLLQSKVPVRLVEVPTIEGLLPRLASGWIDDGMRSGIPQEDWSSVVTVYRDASRITALTGETNPRNARILLLDEEGRVIWFHDRGYSPRLILEIAALVRGEKEPDLADAR
jgi:hypothetical protein